MAKTALIFLLLALVALSFTPGVHAFGAGASSPHCSFRSLHAKWMLKRPIGNIPSFSYLEEKAFRHGDIEDIIANLFKAAGGGFLSRGTKFTPLDVKRVYL